MDKKCEWRDGRLVMCDSSINAFVFVASDDSCATLGSKYSHGPDAYNFKFCPFCGADIRKPDPEVIIKRSGGTWVARYDGVDYLATDQAEAKSEHCLMTLFNNCGHDIKCAKPISEIEITDEIAKLRPMCVFSHYDEHPITKRLVFVEPGNKHPYIDHGGYSWTSCRLATVSDLEVAP